MTNNSKVGDFTVIKKLGDGAYSSVYKVQRLDDNDVYALKKVKMLSLTEKEKENALNEVRILASIDHPNVIGFKEAFIDEPSSSLCLVMEYADNGDVFQKICSYQKRETYIKEKKIWYVFIQIVRGLRAFHARKILHRDMKSANIFLFKDMQAKLGDLNVSKIVKKGLSYTQTGTPYYASPEVWKDQPYDSKSDIWSLGCVLYEMCALVPPFRADDMQGLYKIVVKGKYPRIPDHFSQEMATVIKFMLQISPSYRPNCDQILALPIVESLSKRFFPEERNKLEEIDENVQLIKTIRMSKNLFSLTERLPKKQYMARQRSNELLRENSQESIKLLNPQIANLIAQKNNRESSPGKVSRASDEEEVQHEKIREPISKPKEKLNLPLSNLKQRNASVSVSKAQDVKAKLNQSPSVANMQTLADYGDIDDDQPQKPIINEPTDLVAEREQEMLPMLAQRHRSVAPNQNYKRVPEHNKYIADNESQNSNQQDSFIKVQRNSVQPYNQQVLSQVGHQQRLIQRVRDNRVVQVYQNSLISPKNSVIAANNGQLSVKAINVVAINVQQHRRNRNRSGVQDTGLQNNPSLNRVSSKPQLQLPEIGVQRQAALQLNDNGQQNNRGNIDVNEFKSQRVVPSSPNQILVQNQKYQHNNLNSPQRISKDMGRNVHIQRGEINLAAGQSTAQAIQNINRLEDGNLIHSNRQQQQALVQGEVSVKNIKKNIQQTNRRNSQPQTINLQPQALQSNPLDDQYLSDKEQLQE